VITSAIIAFMHFIAAFGVVCSVLFEWVTFSKNPSLSDAERIQKAEIVYGISAGLVLIFGFLRMFFFEKGGEYYLENQFYYLKLYTFAVVGIVSIYPTIRFYKWRKITKADKKPMIENAEFKIIKWILRIEVVGLLIMVFAASMMAKGIGFEAA